MLTAANIRWFYGLTGLFVAALGIALYTEHYEVATVPVVLGVLWAAFFRTAEVYLFIVLFTPVSLNLEQLDIGGIGFYLPTEPLLAGLTLLLFFKALSDKSFSDVALYRHPIVVIVLLQLTWTLLTAVSSELPLVSFKFLAARLWFVVPCFFFAISVFKGNTARIQRFFLLYMVPLAAVIIYTVVRHSTFGFEKDAGHWVMEPFFKDHTSYGAVLAMFTPVLFGMLLQKRFNLLMKVILGLLFAILILGVVLSYTRAAWVSLVVALGVLGVLSLRIRFRTIVGAVALLGAFVWFAQDDLVIALERNKQDSSDNLSEHVESISNVSSDASNLERLNRWNCAFALFAERPLVGWGPGTYQFVYAPFQRSKDRTIISTNNADGGNAHSEYFGPLAEQGVPGMLLMVALVFVVCARAFKLIYRLRERENRIIVISVFLGLITYYVHGTLNNYLDTDKASIPFWGFTAILVAADLYLEKGNQEKRQPNTAVSST